ncbi:2',3'-cyclic-nucleotide 2'-phosphodiesterase/5'-or 3'-nucleotidase, 5'-nucleotidase family [Halogranum rubrum]|uniref:2',3'-cyclic-nucleotide 2'-phosphodiesterase/5'-or 3'-nucleotidase, 5'-nucleotidase family n=1 Tax=Halogranum rubrum TaxID=553466 RepID=A0A1I4FZ00_9EURY|nr:5'-nucleotidase C-terminal domain-containing protein [Halogranum rubrum]SFL23128.1 2',3'-cyclic-nucleotide 2'-phosphodiesterase/5'-or 3'-nucleotidase, 5'-nucleotidase family [Halogranum rubrum]
MRRVTTLFLLVCLVTTGFAPVTAQPTTDSAQAVSPASTSATETLAQTENNSTTLTVLTYNDIQTAAAEDGNLPRLVTLIERRRAAHDNPTVVAGAGDQISPHALSPVSQWRAPVAVLNQIDPDADVVGNHEFDYGLEQMSNVTADSEFPWLATNLVNASTGESFDGTENYTIVEHDGVRVGFIGVVDEGATYGKTNINFSERGLEVQDFREKGPQTAEYLKSEEDVDVVVALAHTGVPEAKELAEADEGNIDVIAVGDDEIKYPPQETSDTVITEGVARAEYLSEVNLIVEGGEVTSWDGRLITVTDDIPKDENASATIDDYRSEVNLDSTVGYSETELNATFAANYHGETGYGNLVTDAMRERVDADVAITNAGGIRSDSVYGPGPITGGDVFNTLPFANTLVSVELTGSELRETLASQVITVESETGQQYGSEISQQVSGVRFDWIPREDADPKIRDIYVNTAGPTEDPNWERLDENETYTVAVNSFMAGGGSSYPLADAPRVETTDELLATTVIDYLQARGTVAPEREGRMQRVTSEVTVDDATVAVDGKGKMVLTMDAPANTTSVDADSFSVVSPGPGSASVSAEQVTYDEAENRLVVRFDEAELAALADGADERELELYGEYDSDDYERAYWSSSRLNADFTANFEDLCAKLVSGESESDDSETSGTADEQAQSVDASATSPASA